MNRVHCAICGKLDPHELKTYYINGDASNASPSNTLIVCNTCNSKLVKKRSEVMMKVLLDEMNKKDSITDIVNNGEGKLPWGILWKNYDIIIFEGYECTGKTTMLNIFKNSVDNVSYRPSYEKLGIDKYLDRSKRYILGISVIDQYLQTLSISGNIKMSPLVLDRSIFSAIAYNNYYGTEDESSFEDACSAYSRLFNSCKVLVIYRYHPSKSVASLLHSSMIRSRSSLDTYDDETFSDYYKKYCTFDKLFRESFDEFNVDVIGVSTESMDVSVIQDVTKFDNYDSMIVGTTF